MAASKKRQISKRNQGSILSEHQDACSCNHQTYIAILRQSFGDSTAFVTSVQCVEQFWREAKVGHRTQETKHGRQCFDRHNDEPTSLRKVNKSHFHQFTSGSNQSPAQSYLDIDK